MLYVLEIRRQRMLGASMDFKLFAILFTACMCGSYKNRRNFPAPFQGHLAHASDSYEKQMEYVRPYYMEEYGNIGDHIDETMKNKDKGEISIND